MKLGILIGSMPYKNPKIAVELINKYSDTIIPCWPQLPKKSFKEQMCPQYSENFPGIVINELNEKIFVDIERYDKEIETFYHNYINHNIEYFKISFDYAAGFYELIDKLPTFNTPFVKLQTTGPITFALTVKTLDGKAIFYDTQLRDTVVRHIIMKSVWQIHQLKTINNKLNNIILFLDEPYLAAYGSAFTAVSREEIILCLTETISEIKNILSSTNLLVGIHCCANTDWSILTDIPNLNIISFDAHDFFDNFVLYASNIHNFVSRGGILAWGLVPNNENIFNEPTELLLTKFQKYLDSLQQKGLQKENLVKNFFITPQCGLGNTTQEVTQQVLETSSELVGLISKKSVI